ncbi:MAG: hypothetical protein A2148_12370 [Chloroflexi bacterium RBG_16_68_14]|nr:MAG: hypothetical protein A2148_12370 [Chloroflexi bacterium RBG_16_68_14]
MYTVRLVQALAEVAPRHAYLLLTAAQAPPAPLPPESPIEQRTAPYAVGGLGQHLWLPLALRSLGIDLLIITHPASAPLWSPCPRLVFVHDLIPLTQPRFYNAAKRLYYRTVVRWSLRRAARVLVDSESTRRDCQRLLGLTAERLCVVYGGVGEQYHESTNGSKATSARPYVLYVGNKRPHKNVDRLIEAFALLLREGDPGCDLVIAGRDEPGDIETDGRRLRALAERLHLDGRVRFLGEVSGEELPALYRGAEVLAYLSSYEGFGLPPLEAMACGTPVIALNASSLPEVVGDGGLLVDAPEPAIVAEGLRALLTDRPLRDRLAQRAVQQARRFSWEKTAQAVAQQMDAALEARKAA